jgi:hypothetical protein
MQRSFQSHEKYFVDVIPTLVLVRHHLKMSSLDLYFPP